MQPSSTSTRFPLAAWAAAAVYGVLVYAALPAGVVACNDDFGYLKSVVQTLQHGRPWTNDWLEPWSASLSVLSALLYKATGSFLVATQGLQAIAGALAWLGAMALFRARSVSMAGACALALLLLGFPVLVWKALEYGSMVLYLPCLLWAVWAAEKGRWMLFLLVWAVAVASRQSAIAWLALPLVALVRSMRGEGGGEWRAPSLVLSVGAGWLAVLFTGMNPTHAQIVRTSSIFWRIDLESFVAGLGVGISVYLLAAGIGRWVMALAGYPAVLAWPRRFGWPLALAGVALVCLFDPRRLVSWDFVAMTDGASGYYAKLVLALSVAGWLFVRARLAALPFALALASLLVLALRPERYDYYYTDTALAAFFGARRPQLGAITAPFPAAFSRVFSVIAMTLGVALLTYQAREGYRLKCGLDRAWASCSVYETALRMDRIAPTELRHAPFGYAGWHLHPYAVSKGSDTFRRFFDFDRASRSVELQVHRAGEGGQHTSAADSTALAAGVHRVGWIRDDHFVLRRTAVATETPRRPADYRFQPFPLSDTEWKALIEGPPLK